MKKEIIGVIGGIASGKSTVLSILQGDFSYRILRMDELAKALYQEEAVLREMKKLLPDSVFTREGALSFPRLRSLLFTEPERKKHLEELIHPLVFQEVSKEIAKLRALGEKLAVETALPNQDFLSQCDLIFYLEASEETRCQRLIESRGLNKEEALRIIQSQSVERFREKAQLVINTEESIERVRDEICQYFQRV
nr:dephospho-CoA kinase [uncultured Oribacterium sp.]